MNILTWFKPTMELNILMALMCTNFPGTRQDVRKGEAGQSWSDARFLLHSQEEEEDHSLARDEGKCLRASLSLSNTLSFILKHCSIKQRLFMSASHNPNQNNVKGLKWPEVVSCLEG